ncbi:hypothetical protein C482_05246 [Natrialba chahannaoensis JCM 10990]|uniref:Uncharacterized protein n=1 Tax=Natrialba chahannaoensis JCM 10990 TaxID=1227492 RepID=M0AVN1_9EURY|nr:hypothetical protein C482_05246 [Natrialba chahannaoensis JCM 10990]
MHCELTIHCNCGTDIRADPTQGAITCPDCESTFAARIIDLETTNASRYFHGTHSYRGP